MDYYRFGLDILSKRNYDDIEVWDFSYCFRPDYFKIYTPTDTQSGEKLHKGSKQGFRYTIITNITKSVACYFRKL